MDYYLALIIIPFLLALIAQIILKITYKIYKNKAIERSITGKEVAMAILKENDLDNIYVGHISGDLSDHYNNSKKTVNLSSDIYDGISIAAVAVAAHECGHAIQYKEGYMPIKIRNFLAPIVSIGSNMGYIIIVISLISTLFEKFFLVGVILAFSALLFQLITLPVEFDASKRANKILLEMGIVSKEEQHGTKIMLKAAAFTYVAGLISALGSTIYHILYLVSIFGVRNRD